MPTSGDTPANQPGPTGQPARTNLPTYRGPAGPTGLRLCLCRQTRPEHTRGDQATAEQTRPGDTGPEYTTKAQTRPTCTHRRHPHRNNLLSSLVRVSSSSNLISLRPVIFGWRMRTKACLRRAALAAAQLASSQMRRRKTTNSSTRYGAAYSVTKRLLKGPRLMRGPCLPKCEEKTQKRGR